MNLEANKSTNRATDNEELLRHVNFCVNRIADLLAVSIRGSDSICEKVYLEHVKRTFEFFCEYLSKKDPNETINDSGADNSVVSSTVLLPAAVSTPVREKRASVPSEKKSAAKIVNLSDFVCEQKLDPNMKLATICVQRKAIEQIKNHFRSARVKKLHKKLFRNHLIFYGQMENEKEDVIEAIANEYDFKLYELNFGSLAKDLYSSLVSIRMDVNGDTLAASKNTDRGILVHLADLDVFEASEFTCKYRLKNAIKLFNQLIKALRRHQDVFVIGSCENYANISELFGKCVTRFEIVEFSLPNYLERIDVFNQRKSEVPEIEFEIDAKTFAMNTFGYGVNCLEFLLNEMCLRAMIEESDLTKNAKKKKSIRKYRVTEAIFDEVLAEPHMAKPSDQMLSIPKVTWDDIGSLQSLKESIRKVLIKYGNIQANPKLSEFLSSGIVLFGPPGCGKTLIGKALANERGFNFVMVEGGGFLNKYVGESHKAVRELFRKAREAGPTILMLDEMDVMCPKRDDGGESSKVSEQVVAALLVEMDGAQKRGDVFVIAATNRIEKIDRALLRSGRFDDIYYVGLPTATDRADILRTICQTNEISIADDVDFDAIAADDRCHNFSGADLKNLLKITIDIMQNRKSDYTLISIDQQSLSDALNECTATNLDADLDHYETCRVKYAKNSIK